MSDKADSVRQQLDELNKVIAKAQDGTTTPKGSFDLVTQFVGVIGAVAVTTAALVLDMDARLEQIENETRRKTSP